MNPGTLNRRISFVKLSSETDIYGGSNPIGVVILSTWASKQPIRANNQFAMEAGASVLNDDSAFIIRFRDGFTPEKDMVITLNNEQYVIAAVKTYQEKVSTGFQTGNAVVYHDRWYVYIIGIKQGGVTSINTLPMYLQNDSSVSLSEPTLNATYPTAKHGWVVFLPNANLKYTKMDDSATGEWDESPYNPAIG